MTKSPTKNLGELLEEKHKSLSFVLDKVKRLEQLNNMIMPLIDASLRQFCCVANIQNQQLTLLCANGSVATQLRFKMSLLLNLFKNDPRLASIKSINCKVSPQYRLKPSENSSPQHSVERLSNETSSLISEMAESLDQPELKAVMQRIASRTKQSD